MLSSYIQYRRSDRFICMSTKLLNPDLYHRHSNRLAGYDYRQPGAYFITLVSWHRKCIFGTVTDGKVELTSIGKIIQSEWRKLPNHFPTARVEAFVIMPNHIHGIIVIEQSGVGKTHPVAEEIFEAKASLDKGVEGSRDISPLPMNRILPVGATHPAIEKLSEGKARVDRSTEENFDGSPLLQKSWPNGLLKSSLGSIIGQVKSRITKRIWKLSGMNRHPIWQRSYFEHIIRNEKEYQLISEYIEINPERWQEDHLYPM